MQNLSIKNSYIEGISLTGGIVGSTTGDVINCHNINSTVVLIEEEYSTVGGIIGQSKGNITDCTNSGNIWSYGVESQCGGIVGFLMIGKAENCINIGTIFSEGSWIAGIAGTIGQGGSVISCSNRGKVIGVYRVGGIVGGIGVSDKDETVTSNIIGKVSKCYNKGEIVGSRYVGGITGMAVINEKIREVTFCYSKGKITGESDIGSIIGNELELATGTNTYNHLYYLSSLNLGAINGTDIAEQNVTSTTKDINTFEEFKTWIAQFENN